ncbi:MAG: LysR family transcriptional regulator [Peptococcaceae bacterium]|jgi:DNA-binding transcriptional LysR family regulator|nr:LysR family transcriptional regulator [Peptococcaceae bacterium]
MTLLQLRYLAEIAECGSINKAAKNLFVSQSGISSAIRELEEELGAVLFARNNKGVEFTDEGRRFFALIQPILEQEKKIQKLYAGKNGRPASRLRVSAHHYPFVSQAFALYLQSVEQTRGKYDLRLRETNTYYIIEDVAGGASDLGILFLSNVIEVFIRRLLASRGLTFHFLKAVTPHAFMRKGHPLAGRAPLEVRDLNDYPFVAFDQERAASLNFSEEMALTGFDPPQKLISLSDRHSCYDVMAGSDAISIGTGLLPAGFHHPDVIAVPIKSPGDQIKLGWIWKEDLPFSQEAEQFLGLLESCLASLS